ncbi:MAG TPA: tetratricopeptide repeat protein [Thermoanaerobaculia bacterium]|nr:tetratricopeptide repeat protein [Thermoanaerobaculia bacterium]
MAASARATTTAAVPAAPPAASAPTAGSPAQLAAFEQARTKMAARDYAGVVALLVPFARAGDAVPPVRTVLAAAYLELDRAAEAAAVLAPLVDNPGAGAPLLYQAARAAAALGDAAKAEALLQRAASKEAASQAARTLGIQRVASGDMAEGCRLLQPYVAAHADDEEARLGAAFCSLETGQADAADALLRPLPAELPRARVLRARLALLRGQPYDAVALLEPLAAAPPADAEYELRRNLAEAWLEVGKSQAAADLLAGHVGDDVRLALLLARAREQAGDPDGVIAAVAPFAPQLTAAQAPPNASPLVLGKLSLAWGRALLDRQRWGEAVTALQAATRWQPTDAAAWQALVQALRGAGRREEAEAALAKLRQAATARTPNS